MNKADIKNTIIEVDLESTSFEQIKTRLQSFRETL
ncbi:MAG: 2-hydroxyacyl-CoA dehydratase family protein [Fusobacteriaceae bacterium]|nr:2-hydroxyacyl-CoA dehydratase family protein [Fusobacteriaceae bacterium]